MFSGNVQLSSRSLFRKAMRSDREGISVVTPERSIVSDFTVPVGAMVSAIRNFVLSNERSLPDSSVIFNLTS